VIYLDTHAVIYLGQNEIARFGGKAREAVEGQDLLVSPAVVLELEYLREIRRLSIPAMELVQDLGDRIGLSVCDLPFLSVVRQALSEKWTRDPFDRLIVAQAKARGAPLITRDESIRSHYRQAIW
jgi:PIN domain nuclease of toxin-antitoxin system